MKEKSTKGKIILEMKLISQSEAMAGGVNVNIAEIESCTSQQRKRGEKSFTLSLNIS